jgi:predicted MFS family arabinose efflux permease
LTAAGPRGVLPVTAQRPGGRRGLTRRQVHAIAGCYFVASFATLGLPPYFTEILPELGDRTGRWAGLLYVVPTIFGALGAPLWGHLADRFGRKRLLLRAQLGLSLSFLLAGWADSLLTFTAALVVQGILGGTFAASNGYLGAALDGPALSKALTLTQAGARASLVLAPIAVGSLSAWLSPHRQYTLLAVLPLAAALMLLTLPEPRGGHRAAEDTIAATGPERAPAKSLRALYVLEFCFVFSTVISFPYLISLIHDRLPGVSAAVSGLLFALPHLCYLATAMAVHALFRPRPRLGLALGFICVALGLAGHALAGSLLAFTVVRLVLGAGVTLGLVCLSVLAADRAGGRAPGGLFGALEFFSKAGAVAAGLAAAVGSGWFGPTAPMLTGAGTALATVVTAAAASALPALNHRSRTRWSS